MKTTSIFITTTLLFTQMAFARFELNDVSYLFDLPQASESNYLLRPNDVGMNGTLFPKKISAPISDLVISYDAPEDNYEALRVVGMRVDPCFKYQIELVEVCHPQIRLIWQPIRILDNKVSTFDAAVHTFYDLQESEFKLLISKLQKLKNKFKVSTRNIPLSVHPALLNKKTRNDFSRELKKIILETAGETKLRRFTFMKFLTVNIWWSFGGMDRDVNGNWKPLSIPFVHSAENKQDFFNDDFHESVGMRGTIIPSIDHRHDNLSEITQGFSLQTNTEGIKKIKNALTIINRIENPNIHHPATIDCVHCHIAGPTKTWLEKKFTDVIKEIKTSDSYTQEFLFQNNLSNPTHDKNFNKSLRAFGYMDDSPSINQRVINESSFVADELNRHFF